MVEALRADPAQLPTFGSHPGDVVGDTASAEFRPRPEEVAAVRAILRPPRRRGAVDPPERQRQRSAAVTPLGARALRRTRPPLARRVARGARGHDRGAVRGCRCRVSRGSHRLGPLLFPRGQDDSAPTPDRLHTRGVAHHQRQRPGAFCLVDADQCHHALRAGNARDYSRRSPRANVALWSGVACSPCVNAYNNRQSPCRNNVCMQQITVDQVFVAACESYREPPDRVTVFER